jgi:hypothetical protein
MLHGRDIRMPIRVGLFLALLCATATVARAELRDEFESPEAVWLDAGGDARYRIDRRERTSDGAHSGIGCELWQLAVTAPGSTLFLSYDLGRAPVIDETAVSLWVRGDRAGTQLAARVVFPRAVEPRSGQPLSALVYGSTYTTQGAWERLAIANAREQIEQQARVLRAQLRLPVDTAGAYLDRVLVNAYVGTGPTRLWIDDLEVTGIVNRSGDAQGVPVSNRTTSDGPRAETLPPIVEMKGQSLLVNGRLFFPRMIEHRGEPLAALQRLGFNTIHLRETASRELLNEAKQLGMWIVCPPPRPTDLQNPYGAATGTTTTEFGEWFFPILAWDLGDGWTGGELDVLKRWAEYVRRHDLPRPRPVVGGAVSDVRHISRQVDIVTARRLPLGTSFELARYGEWLRERSRLNRAGTPMWAVVQTQPIREVLQQAQLLASPDAVALPIVESEQIRLMLYEALASGVRGIHFDSETPLTATDPATRARAAALHLLNMELELVDVWTSSGNFVAEVPGSSPDISGALLQIDRGHLLMPMWTGAGAQYVPGQSSGLGVTFVVPGVPESVDVFEIAPGGMRPLVRKRVTGGVKVTLDEFSLTSLVLLTQDPQVVAACAHRLRQVERAAAERERELIAAKLQLATSVDERLAAVAPRVPQSPGWLSAANRSLQQADMRLAEGNLHEAHLETRRALRPIALMERAHWQNAVQAVGNAEALPFTTSFASLPEAWRMNEQLRRLPGWQNMLPAGDFENLEQVVASGWRHYRFEQEGIRSEADLAGQVRPVEAAPATTTGAPAAAGRSGWFSLRLSAAPAARVATSPLVESPPLWVTSPTVQVRAGQLLRFTGWVNVPAKTVGTMDGVTVFDSIGGDRAAQRFEGPAGWKKFTYYRISPSDGTVWLTAALNGFGEAFLDDVTIDVVR